MNQVFISGNLAQEFELRYTSGGMAIAQNSIAVDQGYNTDQGWKKTGTGFYELRFFGKKAETIASLYRKGMAVTIVGSLRQDSWKNQAGENRHRMYLEVDEISAVNTDIFRAAAALKGNEKRTEKKAETKTRPQGDSALDRLRKKVEEREAKGQAADVPNTQTDDSGLPG